MEPHTPELVSGSWYLVSKCKYGISRLWGWLWCRMEGLHGTIPIHSRVTCPDNRRNDLPIFYKQMDRLCSFGHL